MKFIINVCDMDYQAFITSYVKEFPSTKHAELWCLEHNGGDVHYTYSLAEENMSNYSEKDIVKHWGLYSKEDESWLLTGDGFIWAVTCPRVAEVQKNIMTNTFRYAEADLEVKEVKP